MKYPLDWWAAIRTAFTKPHANVNQLALFTGIIVCAAFPSVAQTKSKGVYRIPYENGTSVKISNDFNTHSPVGRYDMVGAGANNKIVAAADGTIRYVVDNFSEQVESGSGKPCTNNYVWIEHKNGEWTKYSHMQKDSSSKKAKIKVGQFVKAGTYLGDEGKVGCASGDHLHHELAANVKAGDPITPVGGFLKDNEGSKRNRVIRVCGIPGGIFVDGQTYEARDVPGNLTPGSGEVARHGLPAEDYQCLFDQAVNADYRLEWIDGFNYKGKIYFNVVFRPEKGVVWAASHNLNGNQYQAEFDKRKAQGFRLKHVDSYLSGNTVLYAALFVKDGAQITAYHGLSAADHQKRMDELTAGPWRPRVMSVVSIGGNRFYTALYEKGNIGGWEAKSFLTAAEYQTHFDDNKAKGRQLAYLNVYEHQGQPRFSAIWNSTTQGTFKARHDLTGNAYQDEWEAALKSGLLTRAVSGYTEGAAVRYAAVWRK